jgi:hypothetical protein
VSAVPDNDSGSLLSHEVKPVEEVLGVRVQVELEVAHGLTTIGEKGDLLVELVPLRLEHLEQPPFRFLVIRLYKGETLTGDRRLGFLAASKRQQTFR